MILAEIRDGTINPTGGDLQMLDEINGERVMLDIRVIDKRSVDQNAYYWGVVLPEFSRGLREQGYALGEYSVHEMCKQKFLKTAKVKVAGETIIIPDSTTRLSKKKFTQYIEDIKMFASNEFHIVISDAT